VCAAVAIACVTARRRAGPRRPRVGRPRVVEPVAQTARARASAQMLPPPPALLGPLEPAGAVAVGGHVRPVEELKAALLRVRRRF
jgi:hypothetical protein